MSDQKPIIIFDFDGTLANSFEDVMRIFNKLAIEYHLQEVRVEELPTLRKISSREILKKFNFPAWRLPFLLRKGKKMFGEILPTISLFPEIKNVILELKNKGCVLGILSSNSEENIRKFLSNNQLDIFDFIYTENNLFGKDKVLNKIIKKLDLDRQKIIYIGDETRDVEAAKKCGVRSIAVSWGFNDREILEKFEPDHLIDRPEELLKIL